MWPAIFDNVVTVVMKLGARDFGLPSDEYVKYELDGCSWTATSTRQVSGNGTVSYGGDVTCRIPDEAFERAGIEIVDRRGLQAAPDKSKAFYPMTGAWLFKGAVEGDVTAQNINKLLADMKPFSFIAKEVAQNTGAIGSHVKFRGQ